MERIKRIKDGKIYDTYSAIEVARFWNGLSPNDFRYVREMLYKTKKGAWFLHGCGGAMTQWSESCGNSIIGGGNITPMTADEALKWCEESSIDAGIIEANFEITEA